MYKRARVIVLSLVLLPALVAQAQSPEDRAVLRAAASFIRDSLPEQAIVVDNEMFRSQPAISASDADDVAQAIGAQRGRATDVVSCVRAPDRPKVCTAKERKTVIAFARPVVRGDSADVDVYWVYPDRTSQPVGATARLTLTRAGGGRWQVQSMLHTSIS